MKPETPPTVKPIKDKDTVTVYTLPDADFDLETNKTLLSPTVTAALTLQPWHGQLSVDGVRAALQEQIDKVVSGDMSRPEAMLLCQATSLDFLFSDLVKRAKKQDQMQHFDAFLRLALKTQNQCRMTLETLSNVKNPAIVFARQANFSGGHQQINNGASGDSEEKEIKPNKILEKTHGERMDTGATSKAIPINSHLEAVGKEHRPKDRSR